MKIEDIKTHNESANRLGKILWNYVSSKINPQPMTPEQEQERLKARLLEILHDEIEIECQGSMFEIPMYSIVGREKAVERILQEIAKLPQAKPAGD